MIMLNFLHCQKMIAALYDRKAMTTAVFNQCLGVMTTETATIVYLSSETAQNCTMCTGHKIFGKREDHYYKLLLYVKKVT